MSKPRPSYAMLLMFGVALCPALLAQPLLALGSELQINSYTTDRQGLPEIAVADDGDFVVVWQSFGQDSSQDGVFARRFSAAGAPQGEEFQVNSQTLGNQNQADAAADGSGDFVVVWTSYQDGSSLGIIGRRFDAAGVPQASEFLVNAYTTGYQQLPAVAVESDGDFVVAWRSLGQDGDSEGVFMRRFTSSGLAQGVELQVNSYTTGAQFFAAVAVDDAGDFVVAWQSTDQDGSGGGVFARRFAASGVPQAAEFQVNTRTLGEQRLPSVGMDAEGAFVISWSSFGQDGAQEGIFARRFNGSGVPQDAEIQVNRYTTDSQSKPRLAMGDDGDFVVSWNSSGQDGSAYGVFARHFDAAGVPRSDEFQVNTHTLGAQSDPAVGLSGDGAAVVAWESADQDGSGGGVFAQRLAAPAVLDIDGNGSIGPLTDGLLVLRFLFGFSGTTLTAGAVGPGCSRCDGPSIVAYLEGLT